ncbi:MAG: hypothetical protein IT348_08870 [Candidatus Eisenbacteria bacterium]|nr:hypothetical protein [Candidatus Eisenbacteria bacterium]
MHKRIVLLLLVVSSMVMAATAGAGTSSAAARSQRFTNALRAMGGTLTVPAAWDGIWVSEDSTYTCEGVFESVETFSDTICAGQVLPYNEDPGGGMFNLICTGSADATSIQIECGHSEEIIPDCLMTFTLVFDGTRTGDSYVGETTNTFSYSGTAEGCDLAPDECSRTVTHATRISPAPPAYCATPARRSTWGELKVRHR